MKKKHISSLMVVGLLQGCAIGYKYDYSASRPEIRPNKSVLLAVGVQDKRAQVLSHKRDPDFVGVLRSTLGIPFQVSTESGKSLAEDMTDSIESSIEKYHGKVTPIFMEPTESRGEALHQAKAHGADKCLIFTLRDWQTDTYINTRLYYEVEAEVTDLGGKVLAEKKIKGDENIGWGVFNPRGAAYWSTQEAFAKKVESLISGDIGRAIQ